MLDFNKIADKWQSRWDKSKIFHVDVKDFKKKKYFITTPYPYMSGLLHLGHLFTYNAPEIVARYKRMKGYNVLFKFAFHCTGTPIISAAQRVKENEKSQIETLKKMGINEKDIPKFSDPNHWVEYFPRETLKDIKKMGYSLDPRYTFITTSLNEPYDAMVKWQFNKLKEKEYIKKGKHPVIWCPKDNVPVGDHDRSEGEGETLKDFIWIKFKLIDSDLILMAGTTRPDALYGQTHLWVDPNAEYFIVKVKNEKWVVGKEAVNKIEDQLEKIEIIKTIKSKDLIGRWAKGPLVNYNLYVVPAWFIDSNVGSGIVYSALEDPVDLFELKRIHSDMDILNEFNLDKKIVEELKPFSIIKIDGMGDNLGEEIGKEFEIKSPNDKAKIEAAKDELNKRVFRKGVMKDNCGKCAGMPVPQAQEYLKKSLTKSREAVMFYEISGKVVCRCLTECIVKMVSDQWFIEYNDPKWKKLSHKCLSSMKLYPEQVRKQFEYVLDWLHRWACTREFGLGTRLPWDDKWVIESLSDSTLQMAYCTIAKYLQHPEDYGFKIDKINDKFFDYIFLSKGNVESVEKSTGIQKKMIEAMKKEFEYWYPFDFRNSAKDLIQNHLAFCIFNHVALFPEKHWPVSYLLNGRIMVNNEKMSKSKGNFFTMRDLYEKHGPDIVRLTSANAGEGVDDANYDMEFLDISKRRLNELYSFINDNYNKGRSSMLGIDKWFESSINQMIVKTTSLLENMLFKSAVQSSFLDMQRNLKWYLKRTNNDLNKQLVNFFIETQIKLLTPFTPHFSEECWELIGKKGFVSDAEWPIAEEIKIRPELENGEDIIRNIIKDMREVIKLSKIEKPSTIKLFVSEQWKYDLFNKVNDLLTKTQNTGQIFKDIMNEINFKKFGKEISKFLPQMINTRKIPTTILSQKSELTILQEAQAFFKSEFNCDIQIISADKSDLQKARQTMPSKPAIFVE